MIGWLDRVVPLHEVSLVVHFPWLFVWVACGRAVALVKFVLSPGAALHSCLIFRKLILQMYCLSPGQFPLLSVSVEIWRRPTLFLFIFPQESDAFKNKQISK